MRLTNVQIR